MPLAAASTAAGMSSSCRGRSTSRGVVSVRAKGGKTDESSVMTEAYRSRPPFLPAPRPGYGCSGGVGAQRPLDVLANVRQVHRLGHEEVVKHVFVHGQDADPVAGKVRSAVKRFSGDAD